MKSRAAVLLAGLLIFPGMIRAQDATVPSAVPKAAATMNLEKIFETFYETKEISDALKSGEDEYKKDVQGGMAAPQGKTGDDLAAARKALQDEMQKDRLKIQEDVLSGRRHVMEDLSKVIHAYEIAHGIDVVVDTSEGAPTGLAYGFNDRLPGTADLGHIPDITIPIIDQLYADHPDKYTGAAPVPVIKPVLAAVATVDIRKVEASYARLVDFPAKIKVEKAAMQKKLDDEIALVRAATDPQQKAALQEAVNAMTNDQRNKLQIEYMSVHKGATDDIVQAINDYSANHSAYILDTSPDSNGNGYPKISPGAENLRGAPDITAEIITRVNAAWQSNELKDTEPATATPKTTP